MRGKVHVFVAGIVVVALCSGCGIFGPRRASTFEGDGGFALSQGKSALLAGDRAAAQRHLQKAASEGQSAEAHYYLALLNQGKDRDAAVRHIQESLQIYPSAQGFLLKGALLETKQPEQALQSYRMGLKRAEPGTKLTGLLHRNMGLVLARQGSWKKARPHMQKYVDTAAQRGQTLTDPDLALWGLCLYRAGEEDRARDTWDDIKSERIQEKIQQAIREGGVEVTSFE